MDGKVPKAKPEEVQDYLRRLDAADWGASLGAAEKARAKPNRKSPTNDAEPLSRVKKKAASKPKPPLDPQYARRLRKTPQGCCSWFGCSAIRWTSGPLAEGWRR